MCPKPTSFVHLFEVFLCINVNFVEIGLGFEVFDAHQRLVGD